MLHKIKLLPLVLLLALFVSSCEVEPTSPNQVPNTITGEIELYDADSDTLIADRSGANVILVGTQFITSSDENGKYTLQNVPPGLYVMQITKPGFDTVTLSRVEYSGVGVEFISMVRLQKLVTGSITIANVSLVQVRSLIGTPVVDSIKLGQVWDPDSQAVRLDTFAYIGADTLWDSSVLYVISGSTDRVPLEKLTIRFNSPNGSIHGNPGYRWKFLADGNTFTDVLDKRALNDMLGSFAGPWKVQYTASRGSGYPSPAQEIWSNEVLLPR